MGGGLGEGEADTNDLRREYKGVRFVAGVEGSLGGKGGDGEMSAAVMDLSGLVTKVDSGDYEQMGARPCELAVVKAMARKVVGSEVSAGCERDSELGVAAWSTGDRRTLAVNEPRYCRLILLNRDHQQVWPNPYNPR